MARCIIRLLACVTCLALGAIAVRAHSSNPFMQLEEFDFAPVRTYAVLRANGLRVRPQRRDLGAVQLPTLGNAVSFGSFEAVNASRTDAPHMLHVGFEVFGQEYQLELEPFELVHSDATVRITGPDGIVVVRPLSANTYRGRVLQKSFETLVNVGEASIVVHGENTSGQLDADAEFDGHFAVNGTQFTIKRIETYRLLRRSVDVAVSENHVGSARMMVYETPSSHAADATVTRGNGSWCAAPTSPMDDLHYLLTKPPPLRLERRASAPTGCPQTPKAVYMSVVADCTYVGYYGGPQGALAQIISDWNSASSVYSKTFNVALGILSVDMFQACTSTWNVPCSDSYPVVNRLSDFSAWRGNLGQDGAQAALYHLMTRCSSGVSVGIAWVNQLCVQNAKYDASTSTYVSGTALSSLGLEEWKIVAHEIGHNFGAVHDCTADLCQQTGNAGGALCRPCGSSCDCGGQYIMNPTDSAATDTFSPSSIADICSLLSTMSSQCLVEPGSKPTISVGQCGNGIKEDNEECDCGDSCDDDPCCDGATCQLRGAAQCDDLNDMCCRNCTIRPRGAVCRAAISECDYVESCDGVSATCPADLQKPNGESCGNGLQCTSGYCTSRAQQCISRGAEAYNSTGTCAGYAASCEMLCAVNGDSNRCIMLSGFYMDGTACGYQSFCTRGECISGSVTAQMITWFIANPIPAAVIAVLFVTACIAVVYFPLHYLLYRWRRPPASSEEGCKDAAAPTEVVQPPPPAMRRAGAPPFAPQPAPPRAFSQRQPPPRRESENAMGGYAMPRSTSAVSVNSSTAQLLPESTSSNALYGYQTPNRGLSRAPSSEMLRSGNTSAPLLPQPDGSSNSLFTGNEWDRFLRSGESGQR